LREEVGIFPRQEVETFVLEHAGRPVIAIAPAASQSKGASMAARWVGRLQGRATTDEILRELRGHE
jgi:hypothetical protein